jgi:hypothetical protein
MTMPSESTLGAKLVWHYTVKPFFMSIVADGAIKPSAAYAPTGAPAVVWFSTNEVWEPSANKVLTCADGSPRLLGRDEMHTIGVGPLRFGVGAAVAPHDWHDFKRTSGIRPKYASDMVAAAVKCQSRPSWWFATFEPVLREQWIAVEQWDGWQWTAVPI